MRWGILRLLRFLFCQAQLGSKVCQPKHMTFETFRLWPDLVRSSDYSEASIIRPARVSLQVPSSGDAYTRRSMLSHIIPREHLWVFLGCGSVASLRRFADFCINRGDRYDRAPEAGYTAWKGAAFCAAIQLAHGSKLPHRIHCCENDMAFYCIFISMSVAAAVVLVGVFFCSAIRVTNATSKDMRAWTKSSSCRQKTLSLQYLHQGQRLGMKDNREKKERDEKISAKRPANQWPTIVVSLLFSKVVIWASYKYSKCYPSHACWWSNGHIAPKSVNTAPKSVRCPARTSVDRLSKPKQIARWQPLRYPRWPFWLLIIVLIRF